MLKKRITSIQGNINTSIQNNFNHDNKYNRNKNDIIDKIYYVDDNGMNTGMVNLPYQKKQL